MDYQAQTSLEYLMTYGWALILLAVLFGAIVFIVSNPASHIAFASSDPTKIIVKAGSVSAGTVEVVLQNATGGGIKVISLDAEEYTNCKINNRQTLSQADPLIVRSGEQIILQCTVPSGSKGVISFNYLDFINLQRDAEITANLAAPE